MCVCVKSVACSGAEFSCRHGACISQSLVCDGVEDCPTGDDEAPHLCGTTIRLRLLPSLDANSHVITLAARTVVKVTFTARRYANAVCVVVLCMSVCLSVCMYVSPSVTSRYCVETTGRIELVFGTEATFHLSHTVL